MIRVCCLCEQWKSGGIESLLYNVLTRIDQTKIHVDIAVVDYSGNVLDQSLRDFGISFLQLSGSTRNLKENYRLWRELLRERHYDVVHLNAFHGLSLAFLHIAKEEGVPIRIAHSHNTALRKSITRPFKRMIHRWAREFYTKDATDLWACSKTAAAFLFSKKELKKRGFTFIPNGIDTDRFRFRPGAREEVRRKLGIENAFVIGNVGRLCYQKNQTFLLKVFAKILKKKPESRLLLVGDGEEKDKLVQQAKSLGIKKQVLFYGSTDHVERLLWAMDVFAFPSQFEGLPIAVVEAQAAGLCVVCSEATPVEARITSLMCTVSLTSGMEAWVDAIMKCHERLTNPVSDILNSGFDISAVAMQIEKHYLMGESLQS